MGDFSVRGIRSKSDQWPRTLCFEVQNGRPRKHPRDPPWEVAFPPTLTSDRPALKYDRL